uniref:LysM domain-containing protein n=1 Tax=Kalanchoe fedtschenkoi TaxID=63787 RepID=A0A7N0RF01_KALFE
MSPAKKSLFNMVLVLSALLIVSGAESRALGVRFGQPTPTPDCKKVFGVRPGDTCFEITQLFNLSTTFFELLNPNLVCNGMFVGEWVCVDGTLS